MHAVTFDYWAHRRVKLLIHKVHYQLNLFLALFHYVYHVQSLQVGQALDLRHHLLIPFNLNNLLLFFNRHLFHFLSCP